MILKQQIKHIQCSEILYQEETKKALENFQITGKTCSLQLIKNIAVVKIACSYANEKTKNLPADIHKAMTQAGQEILEGRFGRINEGSDPYV